MAKKISFYFDEHSPRRVQKVLAERGIEVIMAVDENMIAKDDDTEHLPFATERGLVVFTRDHPFAGRTQKQTNHAGLVCWTGADDDIDGMIRALIEFVELYMPEEVTGQVFWLK